MSHSKNSEAVPVLPDTAAYLLDTAERLFAERGIDNVSMREIVRASGQGNLSAAHYHFGSRDALIGALVERRVRVINELRHRRLDRLEASGRNQDVHAIVSATVGVLGDVVKAQPWGPDYVKVAAQALFSPQVHVRRLIDPGAMSGHARCTAMLRALLPGLSERVFKDRIWMINNEAVYCIARWIHQHGPVTPASSRSYAAMIRTAVDFLAAGMAAPVDKAARG
ncbi:TetR family transcriptional regulator [Comamonas composti]|uniref:TetR family transcriptional regulator n=1 Tax=Comamonas composti TaxID=408558 RepID=UPI000419097E|nr:TetR family transcriptional regulator [Comamonas composti]